MQSRGNTESNVQPIPFGKRHQKVEYPTLNRFIQDVSQEVTDIVRTDVFEEVRTSELSFVYYVTLTLYVTAVDYTGFTLFEYKESLSTSASSDGKLEDDVAKKHVEQTLHRTLQQLTEAGFAVRPGRFSFPDLV